MQFLPVLLLGGGAAYVYKKQKDKARKRSGTSSSQVATLPEFKCYEGQMEGDFADQNGVNWHWVIHKVYDFNFVVYVEEGWGQGGGSRRHDVGEFDINTPHQTLCHALADFFKQRGLSR